MFSTDHLIFFFILEKLKRCLEAKTIRENHFYVRLMWRLIEIEFGCYALSKSIQKTLIHLSIMKFCSNRLLEMFELHNNLNHRKNYRMIVWSIQMLSETKLKAIRPAINLVSFNHFFNIHQYTCPINDLNLKKRMQTNCFQSKHWLKCICFKWSVFINKIISIIDLRVI